MNPIPRIAICAASLFLMIVGLAVAQPDQPAPKPEEKMDEKRADAKDDGNIGNQLLTEKSQKTDSKKSANEALIELYAELPKLPTAAVHGKPRLSPERDGVIVDVDVRVDLKAYGYFVDKAVAVLDKTASSKEVGGFTGFLGVRGLWLSYDERFLQHPAGSYPATDSLAANLFPESMLRELIKHQRNAPGYGIWLMKKADGKFEKTQWAHYWVDADYAATTKALAGEPMVQIRLVDKDGKVIAERERPALQLVTKGSFNTLYAPQFPQFLSSVNVRLPKVAPNPIWYQAPPPPPPLSSPTLTIAPIAWWNGTMCSSEGIAYTPVVRISTLFKLKDEELSRLSKVETSVTLTPAKETNGVKSWGEK